MTLITKKTDGIIKARMVTKGHPAATVKGFANPYFDMNQAHLSSEPYTARDWAARTVKCICPARPHSIREAAGPHGHDPWAVAAQA